MRLLIIEDDRELSYVMKAGLEKAGFMSMLPTKGLKVKIKGLPTGMMLFCLI